MTQSRVNSFLTATLPPLIPFVIVTTGLEWLVKNGVIAPYFFPPPSAIFRSLTVNSTDLWEAAASTGLNAFLGFALSLVVGILAGVTLSTSRAIQRTFYPYAVFFQTVPIIAIAPLLVIWLGYGSPTVIASSFIVSVFPMIANTLTGLLSTDPALVDMFSLYGAKGLDRLFKLRLPSAIPHLLTGARIASGLAVIGAIVGEFIGGGGLGGIVDVAKNQQRVDKVFAAVLLASLLGLVFFGAISMMSRILLKNWHVSENQ